MQHLIKLLYEADAGQGGGGFTLADLDTPANTGLESGDGNKTPEDLAKAAQEQARLDAENKAKDDAEAAEEKKLAGTEGNEGSTEEDNADEATFWEDVDKLRGTPLKVEYPEGVDPLSPEGAYHREKAVEKLAVDKWEDYLRKTDPRGYAYLLHRQAGGSDEDFYSKKTFSLPEYEEFKTNADLHSRILKSSFISRGIDEESAQVLVDKAIKDNKLFELADKEYKSAQKAQVDELAALEKQNATAEKEYQNLTSALNQQLVSSVNENKGKFIIPDTDKPAFLDYVRSTLEYDKASKKFLVVLPVEKEDLESQIEALYFKYKKGDLKSLIQREAQTQNRKRLGKVVEKSKTPASSSNEPPKNTGFVALGDL